MEYSSRNNSRTSLAVDDGKKPFSFLRLVFVLCLLLLAGHAQTAWYILLLAGVWSAYFAWFGSEFVIRNRLRLLFSAWLRFGLALLLAAGLALPQILSTAEYLLQSQRCLRGGFRPGINLFILALAFDHFICPWLFWQPCAG